jgi:UDP-N-acetylglucosamine--N-acetylmuramyl-(pentapeptide) pyrophosphoryl-undecaprenol N-acetylglucosamine transferase
MTVLAIANVGGHLRQLAELEPRLGIDRDDVLWVTNDSPQSRSLLEGRRVLHLPHADARSPLQVLRNATHAHHALRSQRIELAVSTGANLALSVLPVAVRLGATAHYVESATRTDGPSMSGRLLRYAPRTHLYTQTESWADERWRYRGNVFEGFEVVAGEPVDFSRLVVTVGTSSYSGFRRLLEHLVSILPSTVDVLWQTGTTDVSGLGIDAYPSLPAHELEDAVRRADAVIAHAGTGSALTALAVGRLPILVPRDPSYHEHVDGHQFEIARRLASAGLALTTSVEELDCSLVSRAAGSQVTRPEQPPPFLLDTDGA